jgi:putative Holliday junction resolvase
MANVLGIDYGKKFVGYAVGNNISLSSSTYGTIFYKNQKNLFTDLKKLINDWDIQYIVIGLPLNMDDSESEMSLFIRKLAKRIQKSLNIKCKLHDERLTTFEAKELMIENKKSSKQVISDNDGVAAKLILESWFREKEESDV